MLVRALEADCCRADAAGEGGYGVDPATGVGSGVEEAGQGQLRCGKVDLHPAKRSMMNLGFAIFAAQKEQVPCALCRQFRRTLDLVSQDGHLVCPECLRLIRDDGVVLPEEDFAGPAGQNDGFT